MLNILSAEEVAGIPTLASLGGEGEECAGCAAYRVAPQLDGNLQVDPEIHLPSPGMDVDIAYYYNANQGYNGPFGYGRTLSPNLIVQAEATATPGWVSFTRGNGAVVSYIYSGGGYVPFTSDLLNTLEHDVPNALWKESTLDGKVTAYPFNSSGQLASISYAQDAVGNTHTFAYSSGLLQTLQDAVGRVVSFGYDGNSLLQTVQDWAGRLTTFQYDTASVAGKPLLATVIGPSGCQTAYGYDNDATWPRLTSVNGRGQITALQNPLGNSATYSYDNFGNLVTATDPLGNISSRTYDLAGNVAGTADGLGNRSTLAYDPQNRAACCEHDNCYGRDDFSPPVTIGPNFFCPTRKSELCDTKLCLTAADFNICNQYVGRDWVTCDNYRRRIALLFCTNVGFDLPAFVPTEQKICNLYGVPFPY